MKLLIFTGLSILLTSCIVKTKIVPLTVHHDELFDGKNAWKSRMSKYCDCGLKQELMDKNCMWTEKYIYGYDGFILKSVYVSDTGKPSLLHFTYLTENEYLTTCTDTAKAHIVLRKYLGFAQYEEKDSAPFQIVDSVLLHNRTILK